MPFLYPPTCSNLLLFNNAIDVHQNISSLKNSFILPVTLWVYGKKVSVDALVDSGATSTFLNQKVVRKNNLVTKLLATPYAVINADGTSNKSGSIQESVRGYLEIGSHKSTNQMLVTNLGDKDMIIGMPFLRRHNPEIDWAAGEWRFTRCPETCDISHCKKRVSVLDEVDELKEEDVESSDHPFDEMGNSDSNNPHINWVYTDNPCDKEIRSLIATLSKKDDEGFFDDDDEEHHTGDANY
jgi:hypothetical protein